MLLDYYKKKLKIDRMPDFVNPYLDLPLIKRLTNVTYLCGMDYASNSIYDFKENISRYDHSLTCFLWIWNLTEDKKKSLAALFHDASSPCFSHTVDYMNKDYIRQESTEEMLKYLLYNDAALINLLEKDNINIEDIVDFKKYTIIDSERPKLCIDRLDGIILSGISWSKDINKKIIDLLVDSIKVFNHKGNIEIGFNNSMAAILAMGINDNINRLCHSKEDIYMMELMASILRYSIDKNYITYDSLYILGEKCLLAILESIEDDYLKEKLDEFYNIKKEEIPDIILPKIKTRIINPLVNNVRIR